MSSIWIFVIFWAFQDAHAAQLQMCRTIENFTDFYYFVTARAWAGNLVMSDAIKTVGEEQIFLPHFYSLMLVTF